jgi:dephospho-CoA kinase
MIHNSQSQILAFVGMPGAGKSEATAYLNSKEIPFIRFGQVTIDYLSEHDLPITPDNERKVREQIRDELGMAAYAIKAKPKIEKLSKEHQLVVLDGLYSWEEYTYLKPIFPQLLLVHIYAEPAKRYKRLAVRSERPLTNEEAKKRDIVEIENINKGGPIAIADYLIDNTEDDISQLYEKIEKLLERLKK